MKGFQKRGSECIWHTGGASFIILLAGFTQSRDFQDFIHAMYALFLLVVGEPWVESVPAFRDDGSFDFKVIARMM